MNWVIDTIFNYKTGGYFVDLAATDGIAINNTLLLEKEDEIIYNLDGDNILVGDEYETINNIYRQNNDNIIIQMNDGLPNIKSKSLNKDLNIFNEDELIDDNKLIWNGTSGIILKISFLKLVMKY